MIRARLGRQNGKAVEFLFLGLFEAESPCQVDLRGALYVEEPGGDLLSHTVSALSSARLRFTVLFEMGRGGSEVLWPPSVTCP